MKLLSIGLILAFAGVCAVEVCGSSPARVDDKTVYVVGVDGMT